jgi:hypothetical protein
MYVLAVWLNNSPFVRGFVIILPIAEHLILKAFITRSINPFDLLLT